MNIPCSSLVGEIVWVARGIAKAIPDKVQLDDKDLKELLQGGNVKETSEDDSNSSDNEEQLAEKSGLRGSASNLTNESEECDLENYDKEDHRLKGPSMKGLAYYASQLDDPYITRHEDSEDEEERNDFELKPSDNLVAVAKTTRDDYSIDVYVYNEDDDDWYLHHDYILEAPPLCLAHILYDPSNESGGKGNFLAVGTMEPTIGIWDLNIVNTLEPAIALGEKQSKTKKKGSQKIRKKRDGTLQGHTDAVLSLDWNHHLDHILASGSSDKTVVLWDLDEAKAAQCLNFDGMVQSVRWHPSENSTLLAGTRSGDVFVVNCKEGEQSSLNWSVGKNVEVESVLWNRFQPSCAFVCSNDGKLRYMDIRKPGEFITEVLAHAGGTNSITQSFHFSNLIATAGDEEIKVWRLENNDSFRSIYTRPMKMGTVQTVRFSPDSGCVLVVGANSEDNVRVLDLATIDSVVRAFNDATSNKAEKIEPKKTKSGSFDEEMKNDDDRMDEDMNE